MFNDIAIHLFNDNKTVFNILIIKDENESIYSDNKAKNVFTNTSYINYKLVGVEEIVNSDKGQLYKVNYNSKIKGYIYNNDCLVFLPKESEQIRFKDNVEFLNNLNLKFDLKTETFDEAKYKICYSKESVLYNNEVYESIYYADIFLGFFKTDNYYKLTRIVKDFKVLQECTLFKDSFMTREVLITKPSKTTFRSSMSINELGIVRFKINGKNVWMSTEHTDLILGDSIPQLQSPSDTLIKSIIFQYKDQLEKSQQYYYKLLAQELRKKG